VINSYSSFADGATVTHWHQLKMKSGSSNLNKFNSTNIRNVSKNYLNSRAYRGIANIHIGPANQIVCVFTLQTWQIKLKIVFGPAVITKWHHIVSNKGWWHLPSNVRETTKRWWLDTSWGPAADLPASSSASQRQSACNSVEISQDAKNLDCFSEQNTESSTQWNNERKTFSARY